ncbi:hypothetical protein CTAYLR_000401 [Chrysophaeum taylorii]|uniref:holo-[acyl-carrier-protein] synthase n=1 Tax=Chrysophaeum taylorii TaxID=2483200 RepID=A0AAD7XN52_9STRA|nr:hypothetical protein CTAYLR_000401 [Chrysophaeum taylorii]
MVVVVLQTWEVCAKKGCLVRTGSELSSKEVCVLARGEVCVSAEEKVADTGARRVRLVRPVAGWASTKCLREAAESECARTGRARWAVDIGAWGPRPGSPAWEFLIDLIREPCERAAIDKYVNDEDKIRALVSRLLARRCCAVALRLDHADVEIARTKGRKPFVTEGAKARSPTRARFPNFNFNISHEGRFVVLASEPRCVCGVDVAAPDQFRRGPAAPRNLEDFFRTMRDVLSPREWAFVREGPRQAERFRYFWSCKEAFTKARGDGLAFGLGRAEFDIRQISDTPAKFEAMVAVDGADLAHWKFVGDELPFNHIVTVARGPPNDVVDAHGAFRRTLSEDNLTDIDLHAPHPRFEIIHLRDLVPPDKHLVFDSLL